ncbi:MAG: hypothetical protein C4523_19730 [Myxococcales bacterium]|nr:MAG: hypothetical protein C4523_19730 [Myxococcales bacterium]
MFLARKVNSAKWLSENGIAKGEIPADAVSGDLKTGGNALSFWQCGAAAREIEDAALAIVTAAERIDKCEIAWIAEADVRSDQLAIAETLGKTPIGALALKHRDIISLDYNRLGKVARRLADAIENGQYRLLRKKEVLGLLQAAIRKGLVRIDALSENIGKEIEKAMGSSQARNEEDV